MCVGNSRLAVDNEGSLKCGFAVFARWTTRMLVKLGATLQLIDGQIHPFVLLIKIDLA